MSTHDLDVDPITLGWLADGPTELSDRVLDASLAQIHHTQQRRALRVPWRFQDMPSVFKLALAGAAVVAILAVGSGLLSRGPTANTGGPGIATPSPASAASPSPTALPSPTLNPLLDTSTWTPYTSEQYGFTIGHPSDWTVEPADRAWNLETDATDFLSTAADSFYTRGPAEGLGVRLSVWSVPFEYANDETYEEVEAWVQSYCEATGSSTCASMLDVAVPLCIEVRDCHPGLLVAGDVDTQAFFSGGSYDGQMVVVSIWRTDDDPSVAAYGGGRKLLEAYLSTMCVWPSDSRPQPPENCLATP
jgi:hypothetical protein